MRLALLICFSLLILGSLAGKAKKNLNDQLQHDVENLMQKDRIKLDEVADVDMLVDAAIQAASSSSSTTAAASSAASSATSSAPSQPESSSASATSVSSSVQSESSSVS